MKDEQYEEVIAALSGLSVLVSDVRDDMGHMRSDIAELKAGQDELKRNQDELKRNQDELKRNQDELKRNQDELKRNQTGLLADVVVLKNQMTSLTETVQQHNRTVMENLAERIAQEGHVNTRLGRLEERVLRLELGVPREPEASSAG